MTFKWVLLGVSANLSLIMKLFRVMVIVIFSSILGVSCMIRAGTVDSSDTVRFRFNENMLLEFYAYLKGSSSRVLQFVIPDNVNVEDCGRMYSKHVMEAPETVDIFNRLFRPQIKALREDLPKYFCQPFLEGDELEILADLFSDRLEDIFDQIRVHAELAKLNAPVSGLLQMALHMILPPLWNGAKTLCWYYPQELIPVMRENKEYQRGRKQWREALEKAHSSRLKYEGPTPFAIRQPDKTVYQQQQENWDMLMDEVILLVLCKTGPYIRYARLVCKRWRLVSSSRAIVGVLGYGEAFRILSGRATFDELSLRLDSLARMALEEFNRTSRLACSDETASMAHAGRWSLTATDLRKIIQGIAPFYTLGWYRDALFKFPGLDNMLEAEVFALFIGTRDDLFASALLRHITFQRPLGYYDLGWNADNRDMCYRLVRAYLSKYPEAANGHPLPPNDSLDGWYRFQGL